MSARRIAVVGTSGNGKTTLARALAARLGVPHVELDALVHLPGWRQSADEELLRRVDEATRGAGWVVDGGYERKLGDLVLRRAETIVWLDQPLPLVLARLVRRALVDVTTRRDLFNGNRQSLRDAFFTRDSLVAYAVRQHFRQRREWPARFAALPDGELVRLRSPREVERWLAAQRPPG